MFSQVSTGRFAEEAHENLSRGGYVVDTEAQEQEQEIVTTGRHPSQLNSSRVIEVTRGYLRLLEVTRGY